MKEKPDDAATAVIEMGKDILMKRPTVPVIASPHRAAEPPSFTLQIDETTTLGQLQVVFAALGLDLRLWFKHGRYLCKVFAQPPSVETSGDGSGETMAQAIREAVLQLRSRVAVKIIGEGVVR